MAVVVNFGVEKDSETLKNTVTVHIFLTCGLTNIIYIMD